MGKQEKGFLNQVMNPSFRRILKPDIKKVKHFTIEDIPRMGESVAEVTKPSSKKQKRRL
ncbi:hypothetical protein IMY05_004G0074400 [Salix suchowensis]|nr:hypothetical protein IMY05_004G0074400 [Salix suchowensis]